jgi:4,5-dihydroxyphthalate decarboxylase
MTSSTAALTLKTVISGNAACEPLKDGTIQIPGVELEQLNVQPIIAAFRRMARGLEFDVCEMAVVTYYTARRYGIPMTAIPVFPLARFEHGLITYNENVVKSPKELEGKKVGMRAYTVTPGVWARAFLEEEHGLDLSKVTWVMGDDEHVAQFNSDKYPSNLEYRVGADIQKLLAEGELAAGLQVPAGDYPHLKPFYPDGRAAGIAAFNRQGGIYPLTHMMVIRDDLIAQHPWLPKAVYDAFKASKEEHYRRTGNPRPQHLYDDPMPMGMSATRAGLERLMRYSVEQGVLAKAQEIDELFPGNFD